MLDSIHTRILVAVAILALAVGGSAAVPAGQALVVEDAETGEHLKQIPVQENTTVALEYTHSVEKTRVLDAYAVQDGKLVMTRMEFKSYGAGLPARANVTTENGSFVFDPEGSYEEFYVKPGRIAGHKLHVGENTYDLVALSDAQSVRLHVTQQSMLDAALH
ncbi:DUF1850 domain-containing protein [Haloferax mediterranei ATCC 33500]|uniref:C4-dicarboxylate ABC transporter n=1 Tax=Haloferax mediterranei (strain ATCC 33500 / DSM 1411 / JCM 8866 / NBRC 14739 / NCIMB 2177 / R-4) TaxID=523841 RepID=I3R8S9_HALMT|nr:DUF1850 domain-containing protein [Haloferax mediterranei]AFK20639.1 hypothetical protein HFX_2975 [Haloferax mediterranei ATCC 33500]AHZ22876.1 C4-dicarboxylate ABC transporter [Haloferax mediterranei ATCC 33500]EMA03041.1 hypothetical protein C439_10670 [Haloferax mediterranei ATCC 33500]MDX5987778.1 DUF1850 domain-containing protein [Haloferax mediterranei ATCC 33500]QCQ74257.1 DUF1850 domain-containing protein [Haloferax mediterranei ATCC 33500]